MIRVTWLGFLECEQYMHTQEVAAFLDEMIHARIGIRLIAEQMIALMRQQQHPQDDSYIGIIDTKLNPAKMVKMCSDFVAELCEFNYGTSPETIIDGHTDATFTYVPVHLEYILTELLKNAQRATIEYARKKDVEVPPIQITVSHGKEDIGIRIRDQGGGVAEDDLNRVFDYSYTTVAKADGSSSSDPATSIFSGMAEMAMQSGIGGPLAGLG